ncbi:MAG: alpha/beta hydrolase [Chitinophagaceae bacterium]|nr:alpha/beta hydrolase [Chitinophagaceae bacterium]
MQKIFSYRSSNISYRIIGKGNPVVLIHGFGEDSRIWDRQIDFLQTHCLLVVPDLPGSGNSTLLSPIDSSDDENKAITITDYAELIDALLIHENIANCCMLGHSMGGYITLAYAEKYPSKLHSFGLVHSTAFADTPEKKENRLKGIALMEQYGAAPFLKNTIPNLFGAQYKKTHPEMVAKLIEESSTFNTQACQQYYRAMMLRTDKTNVLRGNHLPVLFVIGTEDIAAPLNDLLPQVHLPAIAYIHILEGAGHMGMWEASEKLNQYLLDFILLQQ